jgi:hypothetical protein
MKMPMYVAFLLSWAVLVVVLVTIQQLWSTFATDLTRALGG